LNSLVLRFYLSGMTIFFLVSSYLIRISRFIFHFLQWVPAFRKYHLPSRGITEWLMDLIFYCIDLLLIPDILEFIFTWIQPKVRMLNREEKAYILKYFKNQVNLQNIRLSHKIPKWVEKLAVAFVTFNTIHFSNRLSVPVFIHEVVHIWQYQKFGSVYIYRALKAQNSEEGYDYGGLESLYTKMINNYIFTDFNFEQQAEIFEDYCRMKESESHDNPIAQASFEYFVGQVRGSDVV